MSLKRIDFAQKLRKDAPNGGLFIPSGFLFQVIGKAEKTICEHKFQWSDKSTLTKLTSSTMEKISEALRNIIAAVEFKDEHFWIIVKMAVEKYLMIRIRKLTNITRKHVGKGSYLNRSRIVQNL